MRDKRKNYRIVKRMGALLLAGAISISSMDVSGLIKDVSVYASGGAMIFDAGINVNEDGTSSIWVSADNAAYFRLFDEWGGQLAYFEGYECDTSIIMGYENLEKIIVKAYDTPIASEFDADLDEMPGYWEIAIAQDEVVVYNSEDEYLSGSEGTAMMLQEALQIVGDKYIRLTKDITTESDFAFQAGYGNVILDIGEHALIANLLVMIDENESMEIRGSDNIGSVSYYCGNLKLAGCYYEKIIAYEKQELLSILKPGYVYCTNFSAEYGEIVDNIDEFVTVGDDYSLSGLYVIPCEHIYEDIILDNDENVITQGGCQQTAEYYKVCKVCHYFGNDAEKFYGAEASFHDYLGSNSYFTWASDYRSAKLNMTCGYGCGTSESFDCDSIISFVAPNKLENGTTTFTVSYDYSAPYGNDGEKTYSHTFEDSKEFESLYIGTLTQGAQEINATVCATDWYTYKPTESGIYEIRTDDENLTIVLADNETIYTAEPGKVMYVWLGANADYQIAVYGKDAATQLTIENASCELLVGDMEIIGSVDGEIWYIFEPEESGMYRFINSGEKEYELTISRNPMMMSAIATRTIAQGEEIVLSLSGLGTYYVACKVTEQGEDKCTKPISVILEPAEVSVGENTIYHKNSYDAGFYNWYTFTSETSTYIMFSSTENATLYVGNEKNLEKCQSFDLTETAYIKLEAGTTYLCMENEEMQQLPLKVEECDMTLQTGTNVVPADAAQTGDLSFETASSGTYSFAADDSVSEIKVNEKAGYVKDGKSYFNLTAGEKVNVTFVRKENQTKSSVTITVMAEEQKLYVDNMPKKVAVCEEHLPKDLVLPEGWQVVSDREDAYRAGEDASVCVEYVGEDAADYIATSVTIPVEVLLHQYTCSMDSICNVCQMERRIPEDAAHDYDEAGRCACGMTEISKCPEIKVIENKVSFTYDGSVHAPSLTVVDEKEAYTFTQGVKDSQELFDFYVESGDVRNAGTYTYTIVACGDKYEGKLTGSFEITKADMPENAPGEINTSFAADKKVKDIDLDVLGYTGWSFEDADLSKVLVEDGTVQATVKYADTANYKQYTKSVIIYMEKHSHDYTKKIATEKYLKSSADYKTQAEYYYACAICEEIGTETYFYGEEGGKISLNDCDIALGETEFTYNQEMQVPTVSISRQRYVDKTYKTVMLTEDEYTVSYQDANGDYVEKPVDVGTYKLIISAASKEDCPYEGQIEREFTISKVIVPVRMDTGMNIKYKKNMTIGDISLAKYPGWSWSTSDKDTPLISGTTITAVAKYMDTKNYKASKITVTIHVIPCNHTKEPEQIILPEYLASEATYISPATYYYVCASCGEMLDMTYSYGEALVKTLIEECIIRLSADSFTYDGSPQAPTVTITDEFGEVIDPSAYQVLIRNEAGTKTIVTPSEVGTYTVYIKARSGNVPITGNVKLPYTINKKSNSIKLKQTTVTKEASTVDTTLNLAEYITAESGADSLKYFVDRESMTVSSDGVLTIPNRTYGTVIVTVTAGNDIYEDVTTTLTVVIRPKKGTIRSIEAAKDGSMNVTWRTMGGLNGYKIQYSTNSKFASGTVTSIKYKGASTSKATITGLEPGTYYVRVASLYNDNGVALYGAWSDVAVIEIP